MDLSGKLVQNKNLQIAQKMAILGDLEVDLGNFSGSSDISSDKLKID